jgi:hypothetical protein
MNLLLIKYMETTPPGGINMVNARDRKKTFPMKKYHCCQALAPGTRVL